MGRPNFLGTRWASILACPVCKQGLSLGEQGLTCAHCAVTYAVRDDKPILFDPDSLAEVRAGLETPPGLEMLEQYQGASRWARLVQKVRQLLTIDYVPYPPDLKGWIEQLGPEALALEVGSGRRRLHPEIINLDIGPFAQVDVVADGAKLPFLDGSLDMVILDVVLEHVKNPGQFMEEARRVLKVGGLLYVAVPFVHPYHGYPADYHRFSRDSLGLLMEGFTPFKSGVLRGPMVALLNCFSDLPFLFTFSDNPKVYQATKGLALAFTFWLKYLDKLLVKNPQAHRLAHSLYFLGRKAG